MRVRMRRRFGMGGRVSPQSIRPCFVVVPVFTQRVSGRPKMRLLQNGLPLSRAAEAITVKVYLAGQVPPPLAPRTDPVVHRCWGMRPDDHVGPLAFCTLSDRRHLLTPFFLVCVPQRSSSNLGCLGWRQVGLMRFMEHFQYPGWLGDLVVAHIDVPGSL